MNSSMGKAKKDTSILKQIKLADCSDPQRQVYGTGISNIYLETPIPAAKSNVSNLLFKSKLKSRIAGKNSFRNML